MSFSKLLPILKKIHKAASDGSPDMKIDRLTDDQIDGLELMGFKIYNAQAFGQYDGNHVISWYHKIKP